MDLQLVEQKMESLRRCLARIQSKLPFTIEQLTQDFDLQDIVALNIERSVQHAVDLAMHWLVSLEMPAPQTMGGAFQTLAQAGLLEQTLADNLRRAVGLRNMLVHAYTTIDWQIIFMVIQHDFQDFKAYMQTIEKHLIPTHFTAPKR